MSKRRRLMRRISEISCAALALLFSVSTFAAAKGRRFDRAIFVMFENANYADAIKQPFFRQLADHGAHFSNFLALTHPSQGNYVGLTSGSLQGVRDDRNVNLAAKN